MSTAGLQRWTWQVVVIRHRRNGHLPETGPVDGQKSSTREEKVREEKVREEKVTGCAGIKPALDRE